MGKTNVKAIFTIISGKLQHKSITEKLSIQPSEQRYSTEILSNGRIFGHDEWSIETAYEQSLDIMEQLNKLFDQLKCKADIINEICALYQAKCSFLIVVNVEQGMFPAMGFSSDFIHFAAYINADIGFDPYFFSDCEEDYSLLSWFKP